MPSLTPILCPFASGSQDGTGGRGELYSKVEQIHVYVLADATIFLAPRNIGIVLCRGERGVSKPKGLDKRKYCSIRRVQQSAPAVK